MLVTGALFSEVGLSQKKKIPKEIVFIPEGSHNITPQSHPSGVTVILTAEDGPAIAAALDSKLQVLRKKNVPPWLDIEHSRKAPASGYPTSFRYEQGKGVMVAVDWSGSGKKALKNRDVKYFSPEFYASSEGVPTGIPERGPLGGLVTEPAFRDIPRIAASQAGEDTNPNHTTMSELVACGLLSSTEAAKENHESVARDRITAMRADTEKVSAMSSEIKDLKKKKAEVEARLKAMEDQSKKDKEVAASRAVEDAVKSGRIAAKDESSQAFWKGSIIRDGESAIKAMNAMPETNPGITDTQVKNANGEKVKASGTFQEEVKKVIEAKEATDEDEANAIVAARSPELYKSYVETLGE